MEDHIHIVIKLKSDSRLAEIVRLIKANSSKWLNETNPSKTFSWQVGYGAFTVSSSQLSSVCRYVKFQKEHHKKRSFQEEYLAFLEGNKLEYEQDYMWG